MPGDEIIGYITRGRGVTVHKADCINATNSEQERMVEVSWAGGNELANFNASINIIAYDHVSLLGELALCIGNMDVPIVAVSASGTKRKRPATLPWSSRSRAVSSWTASLPSCTSAATSSRSTADRPEKRYKGDGNHACKVGSPCCR